MHILSFEESIRILLLRFLFSKAVFIPGHDRIYIRRSYHDFVLIIVEKPFLFLIGLCMVRHGLLGCTLLHGPGAVLDN